MRSPYPPGPYRVRAWGPAPAGSDQASQWLGTLGDSLHDGLDNLLAMVGQSAALMQPTTMPMTGPGLGPVTGPIGPGPIGRGGPWRRGRPGRWRGWEPGGGHPHGPGCGCEGGRGRWHDPGDDDCGCDEHQGHDGQHGHHKHGHKHGHHGHGGEQDCGCGGWHDGGWQDGGWDCGCREPRRRGCGCDECGDDCHCTCCVAGADLVVETRLGERRVVTLEIVNERRRERDITLELGSFTTRGGAAAPVSGTIEGDPTFKLAPCSEHLVTIVIDVEAGREGVRDVDDCLVAWADLKVEGCDVRPVRIAVAILPRDCGAYRVRCACGCCC